ncbi:hypothetical protein PG994_007972 [Apiospora phragmitis]|uniref:Uncharacterized protein n=1 Tax=Apiospora phragmitis TaxID=2905665 RepID=A0ABR1URQ3_9PEZI
MRRGGGAGPVGGGRGWRENDCRAALRCGGLRWAELRFRGAGRRAGVFAAAAAARRGFLVTVVVITGGREVVDVEVRCGRCESAAGACCFRAPGFLLVLLLLLVVAAVSVELETADWRDDGRGLEVKEEVAGSALAVGADEEREDEAVEGTMLLLLLTDLSLG